MIMHRHLGVGLGLIIALGTACPGDGDNGGGAETDATDSATSTSGGSGMQTGATSGGPMVCLGAGVGAKPVGADCTANAECESGLCTIYSDVPLNEDAVCAETPVDCNTRLTGTVYDFSTRAPVSGETVRVVKALEAITNPAGAMALMEATTDGDGRVDVTSDMPISAAVAIIAIAGGGATFLTATGLASPAEGQSYGVGVGNHDLWVVPAATLTEWSDALSGDAEIPADLLPLGEQGGIVGLVRDGTTGDPVVGATVASTADASSAVIRYLGDDGSFDTDGTASSGIFVIFGAPTTGEEFEAIVDGSQVAAEQAGSADGVIFTLILDA